MGALTCRRCGTPFCVVAEGVVLVRCGHPPASVAKPPTGDLVRAYGRCSRRGGWIGGVVTGRRAGFGEGFLAGLAAGAEAGAVQVILALEGVLQQQLPDLLPEFPAAGERRAAR